MNQLSKKRNSRNVRDKLVRDNVAFVYFLAKRYTKYADKDELVAAGNLGLIEAASRYDASRGKFTTCALWWIRLEMLKVSYQQHPVIMPSHRVFKTVKDSLRYDAEETWWQNIHSQYMRPDKQAEITSRNDFIKRSMKVLTPKQQHVLECRFGLNGRDRLTLKATGAIMGLSRERARQIQVQAEALLKEEMICRVLS